MPGMMSPYAGMMGVGMMGSPGPQVTGSPESPKQGEKADAPPTDGKKRWMAFCKDHGISTEEDRDAFDSWRRNHTIEHMALFLRERKLAKKAAAGGGGGAAGGGDDDDLQDEDEDDEDEAPPTSMKKKKTSGSLLAGILASQQGGKVAKAAKAMKVMKATKAMKGMKANTLSADVKKAITKLLKIRLCDHEGGCGGGDPQEGEAHGSDGSERRPCSKARIFVHRSYQDDQQAGVRQCAAQEAAVNPIAGGDTAVAWCRGPSR